MRQLTKNEYFGIIVAVLVAGAAFGSLFYYYNNQSAQTSMDTDINASSTEATSSANTITLADGLMIQDVKVGTGDEAKAGDSILVHYIGRLTSGTQFDNSYDRGQPIAFTLGAGQVIAGWDEGIAGMKLGGQRILTIPANLAYGSQAVGTIPPNSVLVFETTLVGIKKP